MVAWVVIDRQHLRQAAPFASLRSSPFFPLYHLSPLLPTPYGHSYATATHQLLCNQFVTHSFALFCTPAKLNSLVFRRFRTLRQKNAPAGDGAAFTARSALRGAR